MTTPTAAIATPSAFGLFRLNTPLTIGSTATPALNNLITVGTATNITLASSQYITTNSAGTYKLSWSLQIQETSTSNGTYQFNVFQGGFLTTYQKKYLISFDNISGSHIFTQTATTDTYSFTIGQGVAGLTFKTIAEGYSQISIIKLF